MCCLYTQENHVLYKQKQNLVLTKHYKLNLNIIKLLHNVCMQRT